MSRGPESVNEDDLHAYIDGRLEPARKAAVEALLAANPDEAERVAAYRRLNQELHALYDPLLAEPVPPSWTAPPPPRRWASRLAAIAAALGFLVIGGAAGWWLRDANIEGTPGGLGIARQAMAAHVMYAAEVRHPVEVPANEQDHLTAWLSKRMGHPIKAPSLEHEGYTLVGGRLLPSPEGGAASQLMYENERGTRVTLYHLNAPGKGSEETAFRFSQDANGVSAFFWIDGPLAYALVGKLSRDDLLAVAHAVYNNLNRY